MQIKHLLDSIHVFLHHFNMTGFDTRVCNHQYLLPHIFKNGMQMSLSTLEPKGQIQTFHQNSLGGTLTVNINLQFNCKAKSGITSPHKSSVICKFKYRLKVCLQIMLANMLNDKFCLQYIVIFIYTLFKLYFSTSPCL